MTEAIMSSSEDHVITESIVSTTLGVEPRLFANKFKSVEELEKAYGNAVGAMVEKAKLEKEIERYTKIPEDYAIPQDVPLRESDFEEIKNIARDGKFTQDQFDSTVRNIYNKANKSQNHIEDRKKAIGDEKLTILNEYVEKNYPEYARDLILNKLIRDEKAMSDALKDRDQRLNSQAPGMNRGSVSIQERYDGESELIKAAKESHKNPRDNAAKNKYLNLAREVGHGRFNK